MTWKKFTIKTRSEAEEVITGILASLDIFSVEIEDSVPLTDEEKAQMFVDIAPERNDDGIAYVSFYLSDEEGAEGTDSPESGAKNDYKSILTSLNKAILEYKANKDDPFYVDIGECSITTTDTEDADWINNWKQYFKSFTIDDILFIPSWETEGISDEELIEKYSKNGEKVSMVIHTDPGMAFGTGKHETTRLCIRAIRKELEERSSAGMKLLDLGTGSGILSLLAFKFGAKSIMATDLDVAAIDACEDNFARNNLTEQDFSLIIGNIIDDKSVQDMVGYDCYDVVVANILADILIPMTPMAVAALKKGGTFITSGIIEGREGDVAQAMEAAGLSDIKCESDGEWRCVTGRLL
ncbi:MAG: 50S ribosomal protein L11 methyltransferase [Lachnospiraceae bacterium]|nr:50S ribosomal protein L11 methyltransferase [Lachnospiraceae bacterium]